MKRLLIFAAFTGLAFTLAPAVHAQKVVAAGDEWMLSDTAFANNTANTTRYALNIARAFGRNGGTTANFLVYSANFGVAGSSLASAMTSAGYGWTVSTAAPFTLATLSQYDGVFLAGNVGSGANNASVLRSYVSGGGNVYVAGGAGEQGGAIEEASAWNPFLNTFGLSFGNAYFDTSSVVSIALTPGTNALQTNVSALTWGLGQNAFRTNLANSQTSAIFGQFTAGQQSMIATYNFTASAAAPEPSAFALLVLPTFGVIVRRRKVC